MRLPAARRRLLKAPYAMASRKKILYVITKSAWGGAQRYVFDLATRLNRNGFEAIVACGGEGPLADKLRREGITVISVPSLKREPNAWTDIRAVKELVGVFRRERPDIVHLSSSKAGGVGAVAALIYKLAARTRLPVIFTAHGWPFKEDRPCWQRTLIFLASWLSTLMHERVITITVSDHRSARRFIPDKKLSLIFHGIATPDFLPRPASRNFFAGRIDGIHPDDILIGVTAELTKNKGLNYIIEAGRMMKAKTGDAKFKILIMGGGEDKARLKARINAYDLDAAIFLLDFVPDAGQYLLGLDIFAMSSVKEGLPYAIMEAMAAGLPIVASAVGGLPDLITDQKSGLLVPPKEAPALADAIVRIIQNRAFGARIGENARKRLFDSFPVEGMVRRTEAIYNSV